jgi:predicted DNA-binding transcriptional regulator AlpA
MSINEKPKTLDFSSLDLIPILLDELQSLKKEIELIKQSVVPDLDLTKAKGVMAYLNISKSTLDRKVREDEFKKGIHYIQNKIGENKRYIPEAIKQYKQQSNKYKVKYSAV